MKVHAKHSADFTILVVITVLALVGCSESGHPVGNADESIPPKSRVESPQTSPTAAVESHDKYILYELSGKNFDDVQHRYPRIVVFDPDSKETVLDAARIIYERMAADIDATNASAPYKRISLLIYDSTDEAELYSGNQICFVQSTDSASPTLPAFDQAIIQWSWRHPEHRPSKNDRAVYSKYLRRIAAISSEMESDDPAKDKRLASVIDELMAEYQLSRGALTKKLAYVSAWRDGLVPTSDTVEAHLEMFND